MNTEKSTTGADQPTRVALLASDAAWSAWLWRTFLGVLLAACAVPSRNLLVVPYDVFGTGLLTGSLSPNERFLKIEHLLHTDVAHDAYIVGASTAGVFDVDLANRLFPGRNFYNLAMMSGHVDELFAITRYLHEHKQPIKTLVIGLDLFQFVETPSHGGSKRMHPAVAGQTRTRFLFNELFASSIRVGLHKIRQYTLLEPDMAFLIATSGEYRYLKAERRRAAGGHSNAPKPAATAVPLMLRSDAMLVLDAFIVWARAQSIELHLYVSPRLDAQHERLSVVVDQLKQKHGLNVVQPLAAPAMFFDDTHFDTTVAGRALGEMVSDQQLAK